MGRSRNNGNPIPIYEERAGAFVIRIAKTGNLEKEQGLKSGGVKQFDPQRLYGAIANKPGINHMELLSISGISKRTLERWLKKLKDQNKIEFRGAPKTGGYFVK